MYIVALQLYIIQTQQISKHCIERNKGVRADCVLKLLTFPLKDLRKTKLSMLHQTQHCHINKHCIERNKGVRADCVLKLLTFPLKKLKKSEAFNAMLTSRLYFAVYSQRNLKCSYFIAMQCLFQFAMEWNPNTPQETSSQKHHPKIQ